MMDGWHILLMRFEKVLRAGERPNYLSLRGSFTHPALQRPQFAGMPIQPVHTDLKWLYNKRIFVLMNCFMISMVSCIA